MTSSKEIDALILEFSKIHGKISVSAAFGSSTKKLEKQAGKVIKQLRKMGHEDLASSMQKTLEKKLREVGR